MFALFHKIRYLNQEELTLFEIKCLNQNKFVKISFVGFKCQNWKYKQRFIFLEIATLSDFHPLLKVALTYISEGDVHLIITPLLFASDIDPRICH